MAQVIINEFELVPAPPSASAEGEPAAAEGQPPEGEAGHSPVLEIERVVRRHHDRLRRVWAH